jgi:hypothetical protein
MSDAAAYNTYLNNLKAQMNQEKRETEKEIDDLLRWLQSQRMVCPTRRELIRRLRRRTH